MRRSRPPILGALRRGLLLVGVLAVAAYLGYQYFLYWNVRHHLPAGATLGGVMVGGLDPDEAAASVEAMFAVPVRVYHPQTGTVVEVNPGDVGFNLDLATMVAEAQLQLAAEVEWRRFVGFLLRRPLSQVRVPLLANHDPTLLSQMLTAIAEYLDEPAQPPRILPVTLSVAPGRDGFQTDIAASLPPLAEALYRPDRREVQLVVVEQRTTPLDLKVLEDFILAQLATFSGEGSFFVLDLQTGEEILINADQAMSGTSIMKIPIVLETYRVRDAITLDQQKLISETLTLSGNFSANLLLDVVAGQDNAYLGSDILTESMTRLGLVNTFIATPYEEPARPGRNTVVTPANSDPAVAQLIDDAMQTTAEDIGTLLAMIYQCREGGGALLILYPDQLTPAECAAILNWLEQNREGNWLIRDGVPPGTPVAHKHGWIDGSVGYLGTHSDAAVVTSPGGDYVLVGYLFDQGWLDWEVTGPIMRAISRATYNYFNPDAPYFDPDTLEGT